MSEMGQGGHDGGDDDDAPGCPSHPWLVLGLCFLCGVNEDEETERGASGVDYGHETEQGGDGNGDGDGDSNDDLSGVTVAYTDGGPVLPASATYEMTTQGKDGVGGGTDDAARCPPDPGFVGGLCSGCGEAEEDAGGSRSTVTIAYIDDGSVLPPSAPTTSIAGASDLETLLRERKLVLILDLDHTLLTSTELHELSPMEQANGFTPDTTGDPRTDLFRLDFDGAPMLIKLRPFVRGFLEQASAMFELHVYTLGNKVYATEVVELLDPDGVYFGVRVVSRDGSTLPDTKSLDVVARAEVVTVVIVDDTDTVWPGHQDNLILMDRYHYFASACRKFGYNISSLAELGRDEREHDGSLAVVLGVLKRVHQGFFDGHRDDVREVISEVRRQVLSGCTVAFSYLEQSMEDVPEETLMWTLAERLGAACKKDIDETVTHVVAEDLGCLQAQWARDNGKFLVNPEWIKAASFRWCRQDEQEFPVTLSSLLSL